MSNASKVTTVDEKVHTGKMTVKHRVMCYALGSFLIWLGKKVRDVKTYEELEEIHNTAESRMEQLEEEYEDELKLLKL